MKEKGLALVFLDSRLEHPAGVDMYYSVLLLLLLLFHYIQMADQQCTATDLRSDGWVVRMWLWAPGPYTSQEVENDPGMILKVADDEVNYGAFPYCLFPGCIITWAWSLANGQYMVSWLLTGAPEQRYWQNRETTNIGLVSSVGRAPARQSGGRRSKSHSCKFVFVHPKFI